MMGLALIVSRSLRQHALSTAITVCSVALACGLTMSIFNIKTQTHEAFTGGEVGFDAVLGARGSQLQLVLNAVFHLETSPGNIPWKLFQELLRDPRVELAVPYATGDNYLGYRIVGTTGEIFERLEYKPGKKYKIKEPGIVFDAHSREAVIGSVVAQRTGLRLNSKFNPYHGLIYDERMRHVEEYTVVGVMEPTNTPADRVIWIPIEGIFRMDGHVLRGGGTQTEEYTPSPEAEIPDEYKEVSAVMIKFVNPLFGQQLSQKINKQGNVATMAYPIGRSMSDLFDKMGWIEKILTLVAYLVVLVSAGSILASLYNSMNERRREFAILRALGARRSTVFSAIVLESATIACWGSLLGLVVYTIIFIAAALVVRAQTGVVLELFTFHPILIVAPAGMTILGALAGAVPAYKAYCTDVAEHLSPLS